MLTYLYYQHSILVFFQLIDCIRICKRKEGKRFQTDNTQIIELQPIAILYNRCPSGVHYPFLIFYFRNTPCDLKKKSTFFSQKKIEFFSRFIVHVIKLHDTNTMARLIYLVAIFMNLRQWVNHLYKKTTKYFLLLIREQLHITKPVLVSDF